MLNKKILAATIAAAFTMNAQAAVDLDADTGSFIVAAESVASGDLDANGLVKLTGAPLQIVTTKAGFSIAKGTSKYVRVDLTNGEFLTITSLADGVNANVTSVSAGGVGESYAIFEFAADAGDVAQGDTMTLTATYAMENNKTLSATYKLFETAQQAIDNTTNGLAKSDGVIATIKSALTGTFGDAQKVTATVADEFKKFNGSASTTLNSIDIADLDDTDDTYVMPDTTASFDDTDLATGSAKLTFSGDFSFGEFTFGGASWGYDEDGEFDGTSATLNDDGTVEVAYGAQDLVVSTTDVDAEVDAALKGSYTVKLSGVAVTGVANPVNAIGTFTEGSGSIVYDTTTIQVPYLTTYSGYNQRLYIVNTGSQDAAYSTSFKSEDGVTTTAGTQASGVVPAGEMVAIKATDLVTISGATRTSATIEIEAQGTSVVATSQTVNKSTGTTDTVALYGDVNSSVESINSTVDTLKTTTDAIKTKVDTL
ncbi:hypothetical protein [Neptunicella marina]|uniref:Uncharacterized protein n=1 Tax=Neptunicella marina TaxID=2125989 RepID=A0A8J6LVZ3_9ALTE|nr:hypothetical protein [Neptunicella marina]MBC3764934.1 hypothetical protein [Neptunicella marina]